MEWAKLDLDPRIKDIICTSRLKSCSDILTATRSELLNQTGLCFKDVNEVIKAVSKYVVKQPPTSVLQKFRDPANLLNRKLSLGSPVLDEFLKGGILVERITEISGGSASGKTQLCLQLALTCQLPREQNGLNAGVAYICTEDAFPNKRFYQLKEIFRSKHHEIKDINLSDNVFIQHVADVDRLKKCIDNAVPALIQRNKIGLVIIDSVAALFRGEYEQDYIRRANDLNCLGSRLHRFCFEYKITVVCVNQITDVPGGNSIPSLGIIWSNLINVRLFLSRELTFTRPVMKIEGSESTSAVYRTLEVVFSPNLPKSTCRFKIDETGVSG
uniref:RecA family profile 1 domain-containing protein n=1 Tax=Strigamia maritima TaxID=126957 RepID=T1IIG8_STRMM